MKYIFEAIPPNRGIYFRIHSNRQYRSRMIDDWFESFLSFYRVPGMYGHPFILLRTDVTSRHSIIEKSDSESVRQYYACAARPLSLSGSSTKIRSRGIVRLRHGFGPSALRNATGRDKKHVKELQLGHAMRKRLPWIPKDTLLDEPKHATKFEHRVDLNSTRPMQVARSRFTKQVEIDEQEITHEHAVIKAIENQIYLDSLHSRKSCQYNFRKLYLMHRRSESGYMRRKLSGSAR